MNNVTDDQAYRDLGTRSSRTGSSKRLLQAANRGFRSITLLRVANGVVLNAPLEKNQFPALSFRGGLALAVMNTTSADQKIIAFFQAAVLRCPPPRASMGLFHLAVQSWCTWLDRGVPYAQVFQMPMEFDLKLMTIVGPNCIDPEREFSNERNPRSR